MTPYFITGHARSRTAWLANLLTYKNSFCFHEAGRGDILRVMQTRPEEYVGDSDSSLLFHIDEVKEVYPASPLVIIERNPEEVKASLEKQLGMDVDKIVDLCQLKLEEIKDRYKHLSIRFDDLADKETVETLWRYCLPTIPFDVMRWEMLDKFKVELTEQAMGKIRRLLCRGQ